MVQPLTAAETPARKPAESAMTLLAAAVIVHDRDNGRVVLVQRGHNKDFAPGRWDLPGGKTNPGESITEAGARELLEETGIKVDPARLRLANLIHAAWGVEAPNGFVVVVLVAHEWSGEPTNMEPSKHATVGWVDADAIPDEFVPTTAVALSEYLAGSDASVLLDGWQKPCHRTE